MLVGDGLVHGCLPPGNECLLRLLVPLEGGALLNDVALAVAVAPDEEVEGVVQLPVERGLELKRNLWSFYLVPLQLTIAK